MADAGNKTAAVGKADSPLPVKKRLLARAVRTAILREKEVARVGGWFLSRLRRAGGVRVRLDREGALLVQVKILVCFGADVRAVARRVQQVVVEVIQGVSGAPIKSVRVVISGIKLTKVQARACAVEASACRVKEQCS